MGINTNRYGKKSDKETQSPLLNIFKEIMMKEKNDPEKQNLLDQKEFKRPKQYSAARVKQECDCHNTTGRKKTQRKDEPPLPDDNFINLDDEDICACMSCALKRLIGSECICIAFLVLIFVISITTACFIVFKTMPSAASQSIPDDCTSMDVSTTPSCNMDSDRLKRKIEMIGENIENELNENGVFGQVSQDKLNSREMDGYKSSVIHLGPRLRDLGDFDFEAKKLNRAAFKGKGNGKLKDFYDKLMETDAKIRNLKKILTVEDNMYSNMDDEKTPDRTKRSLKLYNYPKRYKIMRRKQGIYDLRNNFKPMKDRRTRMKRDANETRKASGFVIEKKKIIVEYEPSDGKKLVPKCSHSPNDAHSKPHEHQRKHPFYQNTQRLDELLDKFLNKNIPEIIDEPFDLDFLFKHNKNKCKHPTTATSASTSSSTRTETQKKKEFKSTTKQDSVKSKAKDIDATYNVNKYFESPLNQIPKPKIKTKFKMHESTHHDYETFSKDKIRKIPESSTTHSGMLLSVSTVMNPNVYSRSAEENRNSTSLRHLLQIEGEEEENLGYEDFKEVLTDDLENQDDVDRRGERKKRGPDIDEVIEEPKFNKTLRMSLKYGVSGMLNPNWKGPMPLYPDELSTMIKQHYPVGSQKGPELQINSREIDKRSVSDMEYVEDYMSDKYSKLVEMAQAYSDYGVLEGKTEGVTMDKKQVTENIIPSSSRVQLSADWHLLPRGLLVMKNKEKEQYGTTKGKSSISSFTNNLIDIKIQPTTEARDDVGITDLINHHIRINPTVPKSKDIISKPMNGARFKRCQENRMNYGFLNNLTFAVSKRRNLLSTLFNSANYENEGTDLEYHSFDRGVDKDIKRKRNIYPLIVKKAFGFDKKKDRKHDENYKQQMMQEARHFDDSIPIYNIMFGNTESDVKYRTSVSTQNIDVFRFPYIYETLPLSVTSPTEFEHPTDNFDQVLDSNSSLMSMLMFNYSGGATDLFANITSNPDLYFNSNSGLRKFNISHDIYSTYKSDLDKMANTVNELNKKYTTNSDNVKQHDKDLMEAKEIADHLYEIDLKDLKPPNELPKDRTTPFPIDVGDHNMEGDDLEKLAEKLQKIDHTTDSTLYPSKKTTMILLDDNLSLNNDSSMESLNISAGEDFGHPFPNTDTTTTDPILNLNDATPLKPKPNIEFYKLYKGHTKHHDVEKNKNANKTSVSSEAKNARAASDDYEQQILRTLRNPDIGYASISVGFYAPLVEDMNKYEDEKELREDVVTVKMDSTKAKNADSNVNKIVKCSTRQPEISDNVNINNDIDYLTYENDISSKILEFKKRSPENNKKVNNDLSNKLNDSDNNNFMNDYFGMISDWFQTLQSDNEISNKSFYRNGRKSRMLMSLNENNDTGEAVSPDSIIILTTVVGQSNTVGNDPSTPSNVTELITRAKGKITDVTITANTTTLSPDNYTTTKTLIKTDADVKIVKRNADESNLIFWNDIYDDEYGIMTNNFQTVRSRLYPKESDFLKRSGRWVQDKIKKFADNIRGREQEFPFKKRLRRATRDFKIGAYPKLKRRIYGKIYKRNADEEDTPDAYQMSVFNSLGAKMVEVCKKAALSVKQTSASTSGEKEDASQAGMTTTLMQQLVHLLTDLIDYQIRATTCAKLPPDLKKFLEWLVYADNSEEPQDITSSPHSRSTLPYPEDDVIENIVIQTKVPESTYYPLVMPVEIKYDTRNRYADTVRSIQDLVDAYEDISDLDKYNNVQTGVPYHRNRGSHGNKRRKPKYRFKRKASKFVKTFGKKHTRTTASYYYDSIMSTDMKNKSPPMAKLQTPAKSFKRNLKDVYYKAIAEAKKFASCGKDSHRNVISYTTGPATKLNNN